MRITRAKNAFNNNSKVSQWRWPLSELQRWLEFPVGGICKSETRNPRHRGDHQVGRSFPALRREIRARASGPPRGRAHSTGNRNVWQNRTSGRARLQPSRHWPSSGPRLWRCASMWRGAPTPVGSEFDPLVFVRHEIVRPTDMQDPGRRPQHHRVGAVLQVMSEGRRVR